MKVKCKKKRTTEILKFINAKHDNKGAECNIGSDVFRCPDDYDGMNRATTSFLKYCCPDVIITVDFIRITIPLLVNRTNGGLAEKYSLIVCWMRFFYGSVGEWRKRKTIQDATVDTCDEINREEGQPCYISLSRSFWMHLKASDRS